MKVTVSAKEFKAIKKMAVELGYELREIIKDMDVDESLTDMSRLIEGLDNEYITENKHFRYYAGKDGIELYIDEDLTSEIISAIYTPVIVSTIECAYNVYKAFSKLINSKIKIAVESIRKSFDLDNIKSKINGKDAEEYWKEKFEKMIKEEEEKNNKIEKGKKSCRQDYELKKEFEKKYNDDSYEFSHIVREYVETQGKDIDRMFSVYKKSMDMQKENDSKKGMEWLHDRIRKAPVIKKEELEKLDDQDYRNVTDEEEEE